MQKGSIGVLLLVLLVVLIVVGGSVYYWKNNQASQPILPESGEKPELENQNNNVVDKVNPPPPIPTPISPGGVKSTFDQIRLGVQQKRSLSSLAQYFTSSSQQMINTPGFNLSCVEMTYTNEIKEGTKIIVRGDCIDQDGNRRTGDYVFSSENGTWKLDFPATLERLAGQSLSRQNTAPTNQTSQDGYVDLMVMDIQVTPNPPKAGDKNVKIEVRIKNIGTKTFTGGTNTKALIGTNSSNQQTGFYTGTVKPDEIFRYTISYSGYLFLSNDNTPGAKDVHFEIDYDNKVIERNETNNTIDKIVTFVP